ncbi:AzlC family ABC transporter permease [Fructobacillus fructosus]|uniref:AzlC family ABC transporter permease n=1 Tax=Fructobacillus fructosus TaxID=1631 RepID=UPI002DA8D024|nr:Predicted branched-chain amino acid permease (azaleucine resistance) (AzlC) [Fructobacillus fructosus]CAK1231244.1 Predicted branched-chain amino acid permease (azaleucine resistance) (AzlC) [Fructobacillus fructosus]CAK1233495.1 Predicted branched-chain amino acid permease (azaleucine resistance) (AzlC) [Fructobacillus fructosus]
MSQEFSFAFKKTLPIMTGFLFLGLTYGIYMNQLGFNFLFPTLMALTIFGGSIEFVIANALLKPFNPWLILFLTLVINSRHLFYGLSMLEKYKATGWRKLYLIFGMCDESFSINFATNVPKTVDRQEFYFYVTLLNHFYWVLGAFLGGISGSFITFRIKGIDFVLVALFLVLFISQYQVKANRLVALLGVMVGLFALFVFGAQFFLPLALLLMVIILWFAYRREKQHELNE